MSAAHPTQVMKKAVDNFQYDMLKLNTDMPSWNKLALDLGLQTKKTGSWTRSEVNKAVNNLTNKISADTELTAAQAEQQIADIKAKGKRLGIKRQLDIEAAKVEKVENWNTTYKNLQRTVNSIKAGNKINATDIKNLVDAGIANSGASPILELQTLGFNNKAATDLYKFSKTSYNEAQQYFKNPDSKSFKNYIESGIRQMEAKSIKDNLKLRLDMGDISNAAYEIELAEVEGVIEGETVRQKALIDIAQGDTKQRIKETIDYSEQVKAEGSEVKELSQEEFIKEKQKLGGKNTSQSIGYGFQTTVKGKPTFVINKDAMAPSGGEYRFESGGKEYVVKGFQGSTLKHEIFHPVFENKFSNQSVEQRARKLAGSEGDIDAARETIIKEDIQYIDQFKNRLKELGVFNRVEQEMKRRPGYNELIQRGERSVEIEKEFINEFLELQNEGALNSLVKDIKFKNVKADVITELKNGADVADYFFTGVEQTPEGKAKVKQAQEAYKKLVKDGDVTIQTSEKDLQSLAKEYKENPNTIELEKVEDLIQQYTANGIDALKRIANTGKRKVPVNTKDPKVRNGIADLLVLEFDSFIRNYDPTKGKPSTYMNLIAERILPKYVEKFKPTETTRIDDLTREIADTKTPETDLIDKESAPKEVERLVSVFEGKEAKAKEKEIIEVFKDLRSNPKQLEIARTKGFGGTPKEQLSKVAEFLFNVPDGTKVSNPSKNVLPTINIVDLKGKKISSKKLKAGEKGIVDAKDFLSLRDYFKDKNNLRRFLNVSLPEYNVNTPRSIVNTKGEIIEVSPDVVGRGIRLPDRIYDYFYEQFIDPTGEMTTPSGRGKGKTSQVPKVYKIKPEFRNPTNEVIEKVSKDILADIKLDDLPSKYTRDIAQLVKGMALTETMAVSNQAKRTKLPAETAAEKKLIADIKSSSSKLSMSEKLITEVVNKSGVKSIPETLGTKEAVNRLREVMLGDLLDIGGNLFYNGKRFKFINSGVLSSRSDFKKAIKEKFPFIGDYEAGVRNYTKRFIKEGLSEKKAKAKAIEEMKPTRTALDAGLTLQTKDFQNEVRTLFRSNSQKYNKFTPEEIKLIDRVLGNETVKNLDYNSKNFKDLKKGKDLVLDVFKEIIEKDPKNIDVVAYMLWHPNSNSHPLRNLATIVGKELGQTRNYEEHMLPFSEYSQLVIKGLTSSKESWAGLKKWLHENYTQEAISNYMGPNAKGVYSTRSILDHPTRTLDKEGNTIEKWSSKDKLHPLLKQHLEEAIAGKRKWEDVVNPDIRKYNEYKSNRGYVNPNKLNRFGETDAKRYNVEVDKFLSENPAIIAAQNKLIYKQLTGDITAKTARERLNEIIKVKGTKEADLAFKNNKSELDNSGVMNTSEKMTTEELVEKAKMIDKALQMADRPNAPVKKIRIFDFDDTLATSKNIVVAERGGERIELNAEEFAEKGMELIDKGYAMDFSDFNKVTDGGRGPLFKVAEKIKEARGNEDLFVLTARAPESQRAIYEFLKAEGLEFKEGNIIGLGNSTGEAKANWIIEKAAEGYNDFYFADDAMQNVKAVKTALNVIDVKSKVQQARLNTSEKMNTEFNKIIEQSSGIDAAKVFSDVKAQIRGGKKKGQRFFIPPSAEDFQGLLYVTLPKGIKGEKAMKFYQDALLDPYTRAMTNLSTSRVNIMADFKALKKELDVPKDLKKETESGFTNEQAVRVYLWNKAGEKIPGLSKTDLKELNDIVEKDPKLKVFADEILSITKGDGYSKPGEGWANGTITTDLVDVLNTTKRGKYLETWKENVDVVFSKENLNKLEAAYGKKYREAVENSLARMRTGSNRTGGGNRLSNRVLDYINNSTGVTMFINARSALLQTISSANYINWSFNNPYQAGKAFANQPQFWKDFKQLINSDYLKDRRNGLKLNISESEIANAAKTSKNKAKAVLSYILEKGYAPTKYADSFAIAFGGASYYRNRVKDLMKNKGMSEAEANKQALIDWRAESEKSQQSSDPSKISAQQSSDLGRVVLQYVNTPMQYARLQKRDIQDIINKRRMPGKTLAESNRTRVSRIIYYAAIQNAVFNGLQQGLFSIGFGDDEISENEEKKIVNAANGMLDSSLRGLGMTGVTIQVLKNLGIDIYRRSQRGRPEYTDAYYKLLEFSPAIKSKLGRFRSAAYPFDSKKRRAEVFEKGFALNNPAYESAAKVITATTNVPLDRVISKTNNMRRAFDDDVEAWMSVAMILGWPEWQLEEKEDNKTNKKSTSKTTKGFKTTSSKSNPFAVSKKKADNPFAIAK
jgi:predicted DNA-binding protein